MLFSKKKILGIFLALCPLLSIYLINESLSFYKLFALLLIPVCINKRSIVKAKDTLSFLYIIIIISFISLLLNNDQYWFSSTLFINNWFNIIIFFGVVAFIIENANSLVFIKVAFFIAIVSSVICIFQRLMLTVTGSFPIDYFFIKGFILSRDIGTFSQVRPAAFFTEPAHLCIYLLPNYYYALLSKKTCYSLLITLGILFSGSTTGMILLGIITLYWLNSNYTKISSLLLISIGLMFIGFLIILFIPDILMYNYNKFDGTDSASVNYRLLGTLPYIKSFDIQQLFFGITINQLEDYLLFHKHLISIESKNLNYANSFIYMFLSYGIFGLIALVNYVYKQFNRTSSKYGFLLIMVAILASDQLLFNTHFVYLLSFVFFMRDDLFKKMY